jgi:Protein of unknown function (DUF1553)/Protein of unknown function (DUF1549)
LTRQASLSIALTCALGMAAGCSRAPTPIPVTVPAPPKVAKVATKPAPPAPVKTELTYPTITISPTKATLLPGDPGLQMVGQITEPAGERSDLTSGITWSVEPAGVVEVDATGYVRPIGPGRARVKATFTLNTKVKQSSVVGEADVAVGNAPRPWDFGQDISPLLTRAGCNTGACHGRGDGQNGFHLSLFGYDPEGDHQALTRDLGERRLSSIHPESSLFLAKATGTIPHVGGPRIRVGSEEYNTLLAWLKAGVPYATPKNHGKLTKLSVEPGDVRLSFPGPQQLRVVAHFEDGHERDVTRMAGYKVNDDSAISVDPKGLARLLRRAEADLVVRYGSHVVSTRLATIINPDLKFDFAHRARRNFIDDLLFKRLESLKVPPSPPANDAVFLRRVSLDMGGEQPPTDRIREFLKDADPEKRAKLVDGLLASRDFTRFWQIKLGDLLEITTARPDLGQVPAVNYQTWLAKRMIANTPWDVMVRELLTSLGDPNDRDSGGPVAYALEGLDPKVAAEKTAQRFMGLRIRCAQCHDHPFDVWTQDDYFGLAATFAKVQRTGGPTPGGMMSNKLLVRVVPEARIEHLRTKKPAEPKILAGEPIKVAETEDPRAKLADWMTSPDNPYFARAMANWVWAQFFGKGIADPPDDLSRSNPPVHPELLDALAKHFIEHKYNLRELIKTVATSEAYAMASTTVPGNEQDNRLFSHQIPRPLTAHQMADALAQATDVFNRFPNKSYGTRAIEIADPATQSNILETFGRCSRVNGCASVANPALSLRQALLVIGGNVIEEKISAPRGYLANLLELHLEPDEIVENLYFKTICRPPTSEESAHWSAELAQAKSLREAAEDLFWALLNSREFAFNH